METDAVRHAETGDGRRREDAPDRLWDRLQLPLDALHHLQGVLLGIPALRPVGEVDDHEAEVLTATAHRRPAGDRKDAADLGDTA